ncbi:MAG: ribosome recycling factor [SAR324 cluster bacterium]|nr:ribosome recycling factor [SAR324 cluster bacterium]
MDLPEQLDQLFIDCEKKMSRSVDSLEKEFTKIRSGSANISILDSIRVDYYNNLTPLNQLANIAVADPQLITITPWEKNMLSEIEKAILKANIGLTPQNDGNIVRVPIKPLSEERRKELVKMTGKTSEQYKNSIRNLRRETNSIIKDHEKQKTFSEDLLSDASEKVQKLTDQYIKTIDKLTTQKETELMEI